MENENIEAVELQIKESGEGEEIKKENESILDQRDQEIINLKNELNDIKQQLAKQIDDLKSSNK